MGKLTGFVKTVLFQ